MSLIKHTIFVNYTDWTLALGYQQQNQLLNQYHACIIQSQYHHMVMLLISWYFPFITNIIRNCFAKDACCWMAGDTKHGFGNGNHFICENNGKTDWNWWRAQWFSMTLILSNVICHSFGCVVQHNPQHPFIYIELIFNEELRQTVFQIDNGNQKIDSISVMVHFKCGLHMKV